MASSGGRLLIPQAWRAIRFAVDKASKSVRERLSEAAGRQHELASVYVRSTTRQPLHRAAAIRQSQSRWYSTSRAINSAFEHTVRQFSSSARTACRSDRSSYPTSKTATAVRQLTSRAPFASTLRPNLTGGTLSRSAGGYGLGSGRIGGVRHFSHSPAAPAQVVNNVSAAVRAFWISGQKVQYNGINPLSGERQYKAVSALQHEAGQKARLNAPSAPGSSIDFKICPTITAMGYVEGSRNSDFGLNDEELHKALAVDFARALKDLAIVKADLSRLSALGDLPISLVNDSTIRVRFPGCDAQTVENICDELGVRRGFVREDPEFDTSAGADMALLFPFAPSRPSSEITFSPEPGRQYSRNDQLTWDDMLSRSRQDSPRSENGLDSNDIEVVEANPWARSLSGYSSLHSTEVYEENLPNRQGQLQCSNIKKDTSQYEGFEGIYKFLAECDYASKADGL
ncbi:MAG: hypothetical protein Q9227_008253 [Pyrenula ochraceoflavens]